MISGLKSSLKIKINNEGLYIRKQVCMVQFSQNNKTMAQQN